MIFNTSWFIVFFALFYSVLWLVPNARLRFYYVLICSAVFHTHFAGPAGVAPVIFMGACVYFIAPRMARADGLQKRRWLQLGLLVPVLGLAYYKYRVFLVTQLTVLAPGLQETLKPLAYDSPMPLAISFFTFEFVHYLYEVYKGSEPIENPARFALFTIYFPSIVSGPIKRYRHFLDQLKDGFKKPSESGLVLEGVAQTLLGFFKKLVIADNATVMIGLMEVREEWGPWQVMILMVLLCVRILFDFSGYSDMAIGMSKMLGIRLPKNFNFPYIATNPTDFWRRWHMSLSTWIRDYIYIPLGGSRQGVARKGANLLIAMGLCGLWHGAAWNFVVWGIYHGVGLVAHNAFRKYVPAPERPSAGAWIIAWCAHMVFVAYGWLLFFYPLDRVGFFTAHLLGFK